MTSSSPGSSSAAAADVQQLGGAVADDDLLVAQPVVVRDLGPQRARARVDVAVQALARGVGDRVDDVVVRAARPRRARQVDRVDALERLRAPLGGRRAQVLADLLVREGLELAVVLEERHGVAGRGQRGREPGDEEQPDGEERDADDRGDGEDRADDPAALVVARGAAHEDPEAVEALDDRQAGQQREDHPQEGDEDRGADRVGVVLDLGADPQPRHRDRAPERGGHDDHEERDRQRDALVDDPPAHRACSGTAR